jgi:uncharacterized protein YbjT (DUF2867 family)
LSTIVVTGATGFTGEFVVSRLVELGLRPRCVVRPTRHRPASDRNGLPLEVANLGDATSLARAFEGADTLINIPSLVTSPPAAILEACRVAGVRRAVFVGSTAIFTHLKAETKALRRDAEERIMSGGLDWTIIRPTMIYGTDRDRNMARLVRFLARFPAFPVFGSGRRLQQPVQVEDLARAIVSAALTPAASGRSYNVSGKAPLSFNEIIDTTARALGRRVWRVHLPLRPAYHAIRLYEGLSRKPRLRGEQVLRLDEDKVFPHDDAARDLGFAPRAFPEGIEEEVGILRSKGLI